MSKLISVSTLVAFLSMLSVAAHASVQPPPTVPEIDGGMASIAIGLTLSIVALFRERRRRK